ncbi:MAG: OmpA family protein [Gemmatimonadota bacterium]|nr:MAG: OmpA family protein [Gemmatimonadota bacterium]
MKKRQVRVITTAAIGALGLAMVSAGCSTVSPDQLDAELAQVRQEMQAGDSQLSGRIDGLEGRVSTLERDLQSLRNDFNVQMERLGGMLKFNVPVHFDFDVADVRELDKPVLDRFAEVVKQYYADALVTVEGFADPAGSEAYNQRLGKRRADAVKQYLTTAGGLAPDMVKSVSYGEAADRQVVPGARGPGVTGIENRRVALVIDYSGAVRGGGM